MRGAAGAMVVGAGALLAACGAGAGASGRSAGSTVRIGFIALTDCASIVMAQELGYFTARGLNVEVVKQASWPALRDALLTGELDAAHCLYSMPFSVATGVSGSPDQRLPIAMMLNNNGQGITLQKDLVAAGYGDAKKAGAALTKAAGGGQVTLAMTYPGGTHDTWLRYWLKASGIDQSKVNVIPIPPPQMVANMKVGTMSGYCVGEPWNAVAVKEGIGFTAIATQDIWQHHPEKALVCSPSFATDRRAELKEVMGAILQASRWLDVPANTKKAAATISAPNYVNAPAAEIEGRMRGVYELGAGLGTRTFGEDRMRFFRDGKVNAPRRRDGLWVMAQFQRFGLLSSAPDYNRLVDDLVMRDLYEEVARAEGVAVASDDMAPFTVTLDKARFDPANPQQEASRP